ncbi:hypothetical protein THICB2_880015 [Thiomonas sp. CB2]|nr:hypothetical protein THICB2_880015 [Thiomonas sp. CB2]
MQECHEQHECKRRVDATLKRCGAGDAQSDKRSQHNCPEVNADLVLLEYFPDVLHVSTSLTCVKLSYTLTQRQGSDCNRVRIESNTKFIDTISQE